MEVEFVDGRQDGLYSRKLQHLGWDVGTRQQVSVACIPHDSQSQRQNYCNSSQFSLLIDSVSTDPTHPACRGADGVELRCARRS